MKMKFFSIFLFMWLSLIMISLIRTSAIKRSVKMLCVLCQVSLCLCHGTNYETISLFFQIQLFEKNVCFMKIKFVFNILG
jgi:hypothetical protein